MSPVKTVRAVNQEEWKNMTQAERDEYRKEKAEAAKATIASGEFPGKINAVVGGQTITLSPTGATAKGSVTYSLGGVEITVQYKGKSRTLRINKANVSMLAEGGLFGGDDDGDTL